MTSRQYDIILNNADDALDLLGLLEIKLVSEEEKRVFKEFFGAIYSANNLKEGKRTTPTAIQTLKDLYCDILPTIVFHDTPSGKLKHIRGRKFRNRVAAAINEIYTN